MLFALTISHRKFLFNGAYRMDFTTKNTILRNVIQKLTDAAEKTECYAEKNMNLVDWDIIIQEYRNKLNKPENTAG